tara:strand:- start:128 stop:328 length:201 start_codon:yes stop_codon:yes gene_type:complete
MIEITQEGENKVIIKEGVVIINKREYKKPGHGNKITSINGNIYINGYKFKNGEFKRSIVAMWYNWL